MAVTQVSLESVSNQETYIESFQAIDENGTEINFTGATVDFVIRDPASNSNILSATVGNGITISTTTITVRFEESDMNTLEEKSYDVGCRYTLAGVTTQLFVGTLSVIDGNIE